MSRAVAGIVMALRRCAAWALLTTLCVLAGHTHSEQRDMTDGERLQIERACERLAVEYTHLVDFGRAEAITDLFAEDGTWNDGQASYQGRAAIRGWFQRRQAMTGRLSRHVLSNHLVEVQDRDHARGTAYFLLFRHDGEPGQAVRPMAGQPTLLGVYEDTYVRTPDGWRFQSRRAITNFAQPPG